MGFPAFVVSDIVEYWICAELESQGAVVRLDSSEIPEGARRFEVVGVAPRRSDIAAGVGPAVRFGDTPPTRAGALVGGPATPNVAPVTPAVAGGTADKAPVLPSITFPIKPGERGTQVANLQDVLQLLLDRVVILRDKEQERRDKTAALKNERAEQIYGKVTQELVNIFQDEWLQTSGAVDESTATTLNAILNEWGLLDRTDAPQSYVVSGQVLREGSLPMRGVKVRAF